MASAVEDVSAALRSAAKIYDTWAALKADTASVSEGDRLMVGGYSVTVAASGATDHQTTRGDGTKLYAAEDYLDGRMFGISTASANNAQAFGDAMTASAAADIPLKLPAGTLIVNNNDGINLAQVVLTRGQRLRMFSDGSTTIDLQANFNTFGTEVASTTLAADVAQGDITIELTSVADIEVGDTLHIDTDVSIETGWNYHKQCLRKVLAIDGTTVTVDQPFDIWFLTSETGAEVKVYSPAEVYIDRVNFSHRTGGLCRVSRITRGHIRDGQATGPYRGWPAEGYSDGWSIAQTENFTFDRFNFDKYRYVPNITTGSRFIAIKNCVISRVRHSDVNTWGQDITWENITAWDTDGILQTHPCIRPVFRNVHDLTNKTVLYGFDMRCVGDIVENCSSASTQGNGENTNGMTLKSEYEAWAETFTRHYKDLRIVNAQVASGDNGTFICQNVHAYEITTEVPATTYIDHASTVANDQIRAGYQGEEFLAAPPVAGYRRVASVSSGTISGATQANPVVITETGHGRTNGDLVYINAVGGMTELNTNVYKIAGATTDTYQLTDPDDDSTIDGTGFTAYTSGGTATEHEASSFVSITNLPVGRPVYRWQLRSIVSGGQTGATSYTIPVHVCAAGNDGRVSFATDRRRHFKLTIRAFSNEGWSEAIYTGTYYTLAGETIDEVSAKTNPFPDIGSVSASASNFRLHGRTLIEEEGGVIGANYTDGRNLPRFYIAFDIGVSVPATSDTLDRVDIEWTEYLGSSGPFA